MCDEEEEDSQEEPHDGNWTVRRPEETSVLDSLKLQS